MLKKVALLVLIASSSWAASPQNLAAFSYGNITVSSTGGGGGGGSQTTPGGITNSVQTNNGTTNSLGGDSNFLYSSGQITLTGGLAASGIVSANVLDSFILSTTAINGSNATLSGGLTTASIAASGSVSASVLSATTLTLGGLITNGQVLYLSGTTADGTAGQNYNRIVDRTTFDEAPLGVPNLYTPSTTVLISNSLAVTSFTQIGFAPSHTVVAALEVSGTVSATRFVGNGAGLTGIVGGSSTVPGGTAVGSNQYRLNSTTFGGDDSILDNGSGVFSLISVLATGTVSASVLNGGVTSLTTLTVANATCTGTCSGFAAGGSGTPISTTTFTSTTNTRGLTAVGFNASAGPGISNTAYGAYALHSLTDAGTVNVSAFGANALGSLTLGSGNTAFGSGALLNANGGINNLGIGFNAGGNITSSFGNTAIGNNTNVIAAGGANQLNIVNALWGNVGSGTGNANLLGINVTSPTASLEVSGTISTTALFVKGVQITTNGGGGSGGTPISTTTFDAASNISGSTAVGFQSIVGQGINNTFYGAQTGGSIAVNGNDNTFIGQNIGVSCTTCNVNTMVGLGNFMKDQTGSGNMGLGASIMVNSNGANNNSCVGDQACNSLTTGSTNSMLGNAAGANITTGSTNILIGQSTNPFSNTGSNQLNIGNAIWGDLGTGTLNRNLIGINVTSPTAAFEVSGTVKFDSLTNAAGTGPACYSTSTKQITTNTAACTVSDMRLKKNIEPYNGSLDKVMQLDVRQFDFRDPKTYGAQHQVGLIAQEVEKVIPAVVGTGDDALKLKSVSYDKLSAYTIGAIQEQQLEINDLRAAVGLPPKYQTFGARLKWLVEGE